MQNVPASTELAHTFTSEQIFRLEKNLVQKGVAPVAILSCGVEMGAFKKLTDYRVSQLVKSAFEAIFGRSCSHRQSETSKDGMVHPWEKNLCKWYQPFIYVTVRKDILDTPVISISEDKLYKCLWRKVELGGQHKFTPDK